MYPNTSLPKKPIVETAGEFFTSLLLHCLFIVAYVKYTSCGNETYNITQRGQCIELSKLIHRPQSPLELAYILCASLTACRPLKHTQILILYEI